MSRGSRIWLITAAAFIIVGAVIFTVALVRQGFDFSKLSINEFRTNIYEIGEHFDNIEIDVKTAEITVVPSQDGRCRVECYESQKVTHSAAVEGSTLKIDAVDSRQWYDHIGISFQSPRLTVQLPMNTYNSLSIKTNTGDIEFSDGLSFGTVTVRGSTSDIVSHADISKSVDLTTSTGSITLDRANAEAINLSVSTGKIELSDISCGKLTAKSSSGSTRLGNVAAESMDIKSSTGSVKFDRCDAGEMYIKTSTGDVTGTLLSQKIFIADTSTGSVSLPQTSAGGRCEISTSTGDIRIEIA